MIGDADSSPSAHAKPGRGWTVTMVDVVSLLLTFFVLQLSMSAPPAEHLHASAADAGLAVLPAAPPGQHPVAPSRSRRDETQDDVADQTYLAGLLVRMATDAFGPGSLSVHLEGGRLLVAIPPHRVFIPQSGQVAADAAALFAAIAHVIRHTGSPVTVAMDAASLPEATTGKTTLDAALTAAIAVAETLATVGLPPVTAVLAMRSGAGGPVAWFADRSLPAVMSGRRPILLCVCLVPA